MPDHNHPPGSPITEEQLRNVTVGELSVLNGRVELRDYDPEWPGKFTREAELILNALGERALRIEHVGSTAVPGLWAKPVIDILLVTVDSADEPTYVPMLEGAGYVLRIREPNWHQHRMFNRPGVAVNLHVFSAGSPEIDRLLLLRDRLRGNSNDRQLYANTKRRLASQTWKYMQNYADAKSAVIEEIIRRARDERK
jgi:GrpB-like predicted nucleotidyltransferase (UPF0157 family)